MKKSLPKSPREVKQFNKSAVQTCHEALEMTEMLFSRKTKVSIPRNVIIY